MRDDAFWPEYRVISRTHLMGAGQKCRWTFSGQSISQAKPLLLHYGYFWFRKKQGDAGQKAKLKALERQVFYRVETDKIHFWKICASAVHCSMTLSRLSNRYVGDIK